MSEEHRNTYLHKVYSHRRHGRRASPVPMFDRVFGIEKPVLKDCAQAIDLSVRRVEVETTETPTTCASKDVANTKKSSVLSPPSTDEDDVADLLSETTSLFSYTNPEDISDRELSLIRPHISNMDSEDARCTSESLTLTFVLTSATDSSSSAADSLQPMELPRGTANASEIQVYNLANLSADTVREDEKGYESPQELFDLSDLDADGIRSSTPVNNSQVQLQFFDSLSTISELLNNRDRDDENEAKAAEIMVDNVEESEEDEEEEEFDEDDEEEEEESFSYAAQNESTPPRPNKQSACPSISLQHSLRYRKKDKSKKLRSSRCIFPEESTSEHVLVTKSSEWTQQAKELLDYPLGLRQLTSTPISSIGNQGSNCLPHPAISTIIITEPQDSSTARGKDEEQPTPEMSVEHVNHDKQDLAKSSDNAAGHRHLTSTPVLFLRNKLASCLPPSVSTITILEPRNCIHSTELESDVGIPEPEERLSTRNMETLHEPCCPSIAEPSSEGRIIWKGGCGRPAKRCRISSDEADPPAILKSDSLTDTLRPPFLVGPDRWNIPYKTTEGQVCEHRNMELCSIVRLPFVEENPVPLLHCIAKKNGVTSYSPDFLESF